MTVELAPQADSRGGPKATQEPAGTSSVTSKGQVTIPKALRQQLGLARGTRVTFQAIGDHIEIRAHRPQASPVASGFGLLRSPKPPVPADFDVASLFKP
jgi:AbrB family looped-hinge helix DNA binding protein